MLVARGTLSGSVFALVVVCSLAISSASIEGEARAALVLLVLLGAITLTLLRWRAVRASNLSSLYLTLVAAMVIMYLFLSFLKADSIEFSRLVLFVASGLIAIIIYNDDIRFVFGYARVIFAAILLSFIVVLFFSNSLDHYIAGSRNSWSFVMVPLAGALLFARGSGAVIREKPILVGVIVVGLIVVSVFGGGRSGMVTSLAFMVVFLANTYLSGFSFLKKGFLVTSVVAVVLMSIGYAFLGGYLEYFVGKGFDASHRIAILVGYWRSVDVLTLVSGVSVNAIPILSEYNYNFHNSFLHLHSRFGVLGLVFALIVLLAAVRYVVNRNLVLFVVSLAVIARFMTDGGWGFNFLALHVLALSGLQFLTNRRGSRAGRRREEVLTSPRFSPRTEGTGSASVSLGDKGDVRG